MIIIVIVLWCGGGGVIKNAHTQKREQEPNRIKCRGTCLQFIIIIGILK